MKSITLILRLPSFSLAFFLPALSLAPSASLHAQAPTADDFNPGADGAVDSLAMQADGKILAGGRFMRLEGQLRRGIGRLHDGGTLDTGFDAGIINLSASVKPLAMQVDDKLVVGGGFAIVGGQLRYSLARLHADGTLDAGFNPGTDGAVYSLATQVDGKILVGGAFTNLCGQTRTNIGRLNEDGTLDTSFNAGADGPVYSLAVQVDGKILVGGAFPNLCGQSRQRLGRLHTEGVLDASFNPGVSAAGAYVGALALQTNGKILVGGSFIRLGGQVRGSLGRLNNTEPATQSLAYGGATITWLRGGTGPEVWRTTFEHSPDGNNWTHQGDGRRIPGGWQLTNVAVPPANSIRARGFVSGSGINAWFVESQTTAPAPIRLSLVLHGSQVGLSWTGGLAPYQVQQTSHPEFAESWEDLGLPLTTNSCSLPRDPSNRFYRVRGQ